MSLLWILGWIIAWPAWLIAWIIVDDEIEELKKPKWYKCYVCLEQWVPMNVCLLKDWSKVPVCKMCCAGNNYKIIWSL